ncbi:PAS domain-containing sensor histidine kinase [Spirochaeta africana]|uniref:histidine kinase n=1 Tax=Spirochaeta africana (strain ATCC 700263 / DSM 8902 / Z-7692) TaxID=889378 RepID=H9UGH1_SPIAZ|nr:PAS domain-containing sensor histidine kinase [Spirochaeta africana]AFG36614.1 PAS domain S-box [Spirochaeta africana DSM 8902]
MNPDLLQAMPLACALHRMVRDPAGRAIDYIYLDCNAPFADLFGAPAEQIIDRRVTELLPDIAEDQADWIPRYGEVAGGGTSTQFEDFSQPLGRWFRVHAFAAGDDRFATIVEDITERKQTEAELTLQQSDFGRFDSLSRDTFCRLQLRPQVRFRYLSPSVEQLVGLQPAQLYADAGLLYRCVHRDDRHLVQRVLAAELPEHSCFRLRLHKPGGSQVWVELQIAYEQDSRQQPVVVHAIARDITETKMAEDALQTSQLQLSQILAAVSDMVMYYAADDMRITWANRAAEQTMNAAPGELIGKHCYSLWSNTPDKACTGCPVVHCFRTRQADWWEHTKPNGETWVIHAHPVLTPSGRFLGVVETARNITYRVRMESELQAALDQADAANIVRDQFIANMSHELRTPLNGIIGVVELLQSDPQVSESQRELLQMIGESGNRLYDVVQEILAFSRLDSSSLQQQRMRFHIPSVLDGTANGYAAQASEKGLDFAVDYSRLQQEWVEGYPGRLRQILSHILHNAIKFTTAGTIQVEAAVAPSPTAKLSVTVHDSGIGIPTDALSRVCEPFFQTDTGLTRTFGGVGLGLTIAQRLLQEVGGELEIRSTPGEGTSVTCHLPVGIRE